MEFLSGLVVVMVILFLAFPKVAVPMVNRRLREEGHKPTATEGQAGCIIGVLILGVLVFFFLAVIAGGR